MVNSVENMQTNVKVKRVDIKVQFEDEVVAACVAASCWLLAENLVTELSLFTPFTPSLVHIVGKCQGKVFEDREVSFLMQEGKLQTDVWSKVKMKYINNKNDYHFVGYCGAFCG